MVKLPIVWGTLSFREEGRPDQKKKKKKLVFALPNFFVTNKRKLNKFC